MTIHRMSPIRIVASQLLTAAAIAMSLTTAAQASAERSWDIDAYDRCMANGSDVGWCCNVSGGDLTQEKPPKCVTPSAEAQSENVPGTTNPVGPPRKTILPATPGSSVG
jgi:hypothetical protein